ncbi:hypothetical protein IUY40_13985 [Flavobacterium sp. ALJ2]|uniref:hypothetical protein n=1 Tax=Flavobacterium sp. ALJ2 TaxID=2786960 RepID=UPI00189ECAAD|nr:hypothetical protein [Flavobacterium sp. ALJ2]MBF7092642.1 hypothetical protein [Flavobacterium sp. ALJ2]
MKDRPILITTIILTLFVELIIIGLVFKEVDSQRLPSQILRVLFQLILIGFIISKKSNAALLALTGFHIFTAILHFGALDKSGLVGVLFIIYHIVIGVIIYFHDWFEEKLKIKNT